MNNRLIFTLLLCISSVLVLADNEDLLQQLKKKYGYASDFGDSYYYKVGKDGAQTVCDNQGHELIPQGRFVDFDVLRGNDYKYVLVKDQKGKWGVYDTQKQSLIFLPQYDKIDAYGLIETCGYARIRNKGLYGVINIYTGKQVVPPIYKYIESFYSWRGWIICDNKSMFARTGEMYDKYDKWNSKEGWICVERNNKWGMIDTLGTLVLPIIYEDKPLRASDDMFCLKKNGKYGYVDSKTFKTIIDFKYDKAGVFSNNVAQVMINGKWEILQNPRKVVAQQKKTPKGKKKAVSSYPAPNSEVDTNIPEAKQKAEHTFAYIIANENYEIAKVPYALNDGWIFEQYCCKTLGVPIENIHLYEDATAGNIIACIENIKKTARAYEGDASIIFYYAGHAFPDEEEHSAYLLPIDGNSQNIATAYSLKKLYKEFNSVPVKQLICFIDACFSGTTRTDEMLIAGRGVAIKVKDDVPQGNAVVFTSATGAETAHSYEEKGHGMYTYYLLQKLQETQGDVTLGELTNYVRKMVRRKSVVVNEKMQTPCVIPSASLGTEWQSWKLK